MSTCIHDIENIFVTMLILLLFSPVFFTNASQAFFLRFWLTQVDFRRAKNILVCIIKERLQKRTKTNFNWKNQTTFKSFSIHDDKMLKARISISNGLFIKNLCLLFASIHTTNMAIKTMRFYDVCQQQRYFSVLRGEIEQFLLNDDGLAARLA